MAVRPAGVGVYVCWTPHAPADPAAEADELPETPTVTSATTDIPATDKMQATLQRNHRAKIVRVRPSISEPRPMSITPDRVRVTPSESSERTL
jgi:hypothetical protein